MRPFITISTIAAVALLTGCGPAEKPADPPPPSAPGKAEPKCPDHSIKDPNNPCTPLYYKPVKGSFKGQKSF